MTAASTITVAAATATDRLRTLLHIDAVACAGTGLAAAVAADPVADLLGTTRVGIVRGVGVFLVVYALDLLLLSRVGRDTVLRTGTALTAVGDGLWVAATLGLIVAGAFEAAGVAAVLAVGTVVAALGVTKTATLRQP